MKVRITALGTDFYYNNVEKMTWLKFTDGKFLDLFLKDKTNKSLKLSLIEAFEIEEEK